MSEKRRELLIGCGRRRERNIQVDAIVNWSNLETLDINPDHEPTIVADLEVLPYEWAPDNYYDEIHAYEVLEHTGAQGDFRFFFAQFSEFWRMLKPGGVICGTCPGPRSEWVRGDPGHTRQFHPYYLTFLEQVNYSQVGTTPMSDYRHWYKGDFTRELARVDGPPEAEVFVWALRAVKPARLAG